MNIWLHTDMVSNDVTGTLQSVKLKNNNEIVVKFCNNTTAMFTFYRYTDNKQSDWYFILQNYIDKNIRLVWVVTGYKIIIASVEVV
jgi:hypothetical protein